VGKDWPNDDVGGSSSKRGGRALWSCFTDWRFFLFRSVCFSSSSSSSFFLFCVLYLCFYSSSLFSSFFFHSSFVIFFQFSPLCSSMFFSILSSLSLPFFLSVFHL
jgi:hypothetical protein